MQSVRERFARVDWVAQDDSVRVSIENLCYRPEVLFASGVPNLKFDKFALYSYGERIKLYADGDITLNIFILYKSFEHARLAATYMTIS